LKQLSAVSPAGVLTNLKKGLLASGREPTSVDNNPCTEDMDNDGKADYTELCLGGDNEVGCRITGANDFNVSFSDCRMQDPDYRRYLVHVTTITNLSNSYLAVTNSPGNGLVVGTSTAYWNVNGSITYHNGVGGVDEQTIEITYRFLHLELHDFIQTSFQNLLDLDNASLMLSGQHLVYRVLDPTGFPALGTTGRPDGMDIFDVYVDVDDDGDLPAQAPGKYRLQLAMDWEDGLVFLHKSDAVLPPRPAFPVAPGAGAGVSYLFTFYDRDHLWYDGTGLGCQVQVENVDEATRTFDIMDPNTSVPPLNIPCPGLGAQVGVEY